MKKIINGHKYDTDTAKVIDTYCNELPMSSLDYLCEKLYQKGNGEFFLHGYGGVRTAYANRVSYIVAPVCSGEDIIPLSLDEAKEWVEKYLTVDEYIKIFGECEE